MVRVTDVKPLDGYRLDPDYFRQARIDKEARTVVCPNGLDPAPELLHGDYEPAQAGGSRVEPTRA
jgi:hypothetical protein